MRLKFSLAGFFLLLFSVSALQSGAQPGKVIPASAGSFYGTWKGSSICQVKNSPCHDENVVYYISKTDKENILEMNASKIVNGEEVEMGKIQFKYYKETEQLISISQPNATWTFKRKENTIEGTLYYNNALYRIVKATKA